MLDIKFVLENEGLIRENIKRRNAKCDYDSIISLYKEKIKLQQDIDTLRQQRNELSEKVRTAPKEEKAQVIEQSKDVKIKLAEFEPKLEEVGKKFDVEFKKLPNMTHPDSPGGNTDADSKELRRFGEPTKFNFKAKDHVTLGKELDLIDFESAQKVSGAKFYYLKNEAVYLEFGLIKMAMDLLQKRGFTLTITPDLAKDTILDGIGFNPRGEETNVYSIANSNLCLTGTAEITLGGMYADAVLEEKDLPIKIAGVSHCFRTEAGSYGQFSKGLYRVHQFTKVEMFMFTHPDKSDEMHEVLVSIEEELFKMLKLPFRTVDIASGDLGGPAYRKFDLEAWMPGRSEKAGEDTGSWGEVTSTSNCTDFQARRLNIKYKPADGSKPRFVHMLNGTGVAISRAIVAIMENYQQEDGSILVPEVLRAFVGKDRITKKTK